MKRERLDKARIKELWEAFDPESTPGWSGWFAKYEAGLRKIADMDEATLRLPANQKLLWIDIGLGSAGPSENIDVTPALADPEFVQELMLLRKRGFDPAPSRRAKELQEVHDTLLTRLRQILPGNAPRVRMVRAMHALRPSDFVCTWNKASIFAVRDFLVGQRGLGRAENHVLARARLRDVLGPEGNDLREHARRSIFTRWLFKNQEAVAKGEIPGAQTPLADPPDNDAVDDGDEDGLTIAIKPLSRQHRWLAVFAGDLDAIRLVLRECLEPQSLEQLAIAVREELGEVASGRRYLLRMMRDMRHLGLVENLGDEYRTTEDGEVVLDRGGEAILADALVVNIKGFAHTVRRLAEGPVDASDLEPVLAPFGPGGKASDLPRRHLWWAVVAGIVESESGHRRQLTPSGRTLASRLPETLEAPEQAIGTGASLEFGVVAKALGPLAGSEEVESVPLPSFSALWSAFEELKESKGLLFTQDQVLALHTAWRFGDGLANGKPPKRFAILSGLSGTGKTQLLLQYAQATCRLMDLPEREHVALVPVRPDWRDPTGLLGYLNALHSDPSFQAEPALKLLLRAARDPGRPYFLLLDEMNLARVERYFAPFLSGMETGAPLELHAHDEPIGDIPPWTPWPANLRIGGTVNMDETTHPFSDKVLDRAFTLEFWQVDLPSFFATRPGRSPADKVVEDTLLAFQKHLMPIRRHVGYRTADEVLGWVAHAHQTVGGAEPSAGLIDQAIFSKVLPRLRGGETSALRAALDALKAEAGKRSLTRCADKLTLMRQRLDDTGVTGFWA